MMPPTQPWQPPAMINQPDWVPLQNTEKPDVPMQEEEPLTLESAPASSKDVSKRPQEHGPIFS